MCDIVGLQPVQIQNALSTHSTTAEYPMRGGCALTSGSMLSTLYRGALDLSMPFGFDSPSSANALIGVDFPPVVALSIAPNDTISICGWLPCRSPPCSLSTRSWLTRFALATQPPSRLRMVGYDDMPIPDSTVPLWYDRFSAQLICAV